VSEKQKSKKAKKKVKMISVSKEERKFISRGCEQNIRDDGRGSTFCSQLDVTI
jgi:hypothetical protein